MSVRVCLLLVFVGSFSFSVAATAEDVTDSSVASNTGNEAVSASDYAVTFHDILDQALRISHEYKALISENNSSEMLFEKESEYYLPTVYISSDLKEYYGSTAADEDSSGEVVLNVTSKLWGSSVSDRIDASENNVNSAKMNIKNKELDIYYTVLKYLTKVELTRHFEQESKQTKDELDHFYRKQLNATREGVSTQSDSMEVKLSKSKFDEKVFAVKSKIDQYFRELRIKTGLKIDAENKKSSVGLDYHKLISKLELEVADFDSYRLVNHNYGLLSSYYVMEAARQMANAQRERFNVSVVNETHLAIYGGDNAYKSGDMDDSYIGLSFNYDIYNKAVEQDKNSALQLYIAEKERYEEKVDSFLAQLDAKSADYKNTLIQRNKLREQLRINRSLIENQKNEIYTDKITYLDIVESLSSLNQSKIDLLNIELTLYDYLYALMALKSERIY